MKKIRNSVLLMYLFVFSLSILLQIHSYAQENQSNIQILTLEESIETTLKNNHSLKAVLERINEAEGKSRELKTLSLPKLQTGFSYIHLSEKPSLDLEAGVLTPQALSIEIADDNMYNFQLEVKQPLFTGGKIHFLNEQARENLESSKYTYEEAKQYLILKVKEIYFGILASEKFKKVAQDAVKQMQAHLETVKGLYDAGSAPYIDLLRTEVQLANIEQQLIKVDNKVELTKSLFNTLLGKGLDSPVDVVDVFETTEEEFYFNRLIQEAKKNRPEIYKIKHNINMLKAGVKVVQSNFWPQVGLFTNYKYHKGDEAIIEWQDEWMLGINVSMDIWNWGETRAQVDQVRANLNMLGHLESQLMDNIALEVKSTLLGLEEARKRIEVSKKTVYQAEESLENAQTGYKNGRIDNVEVLTAQLALTEARTNYIEAKYKYILNRAMLEKAVGKSLDESIY